MTCRLVVWNNKEIQDDFPKAKFTLFCCKMVKRIKPKHHLVVLSWAVLPVFLSLRPYWFLCKIVLWLDWPDPSDTILYKTGVYKARPYPEGLHCTRASDSIWVQVQKQGQLTHHHLSSDTQEADTQPSPKSKSHPTLHTYESQWGLHANIKVTSGKRGPRTYWLDQNEGRLRQPHLDCRRRTPSTVMATPSPTCHPITPCESRKQQAQNSWLWEGLQLGLVLAADVAYCNCHQSVHSPFVYLDHLALISPWSAPCYTAWLNSLTAELHPYNLTLQ